MTNQKRPTIADVYKALGSLQQDVGSVKIDVKKIHEQTKKTNGRVTELEKKELKRETIENFAKEQGIKTPKEEKEGWTGREKTLTAIITALLAIVSALIGVNQI